MTELTMGDTRSGTERLRARRRRRRAIQFGVLALLVADLLFMWARGILPTGVSDIPPPMALGAAIGMLVGAVIGYRLICRHKDEHEVRSRRIAAEIAFTTFLFGAPFWGLLAIADVAPPVNGIALYLGVAIVYLATFLWTKYR